PRMGARALPDRPGVRAQAGRRPVRRSTATAGDRPGPRRAARRASARRAFARSRAAARRHRLQGPREHSRARRHRPARRAARAAHRRVRRPDLRARKRRARGDARPQGLRRHRAADRRVLRPMNTVQALIDAAALGSVYALMAVGIGLVFGVLRLVNFAYGQLIMAGAYALALTNDLNPALSIVICFAVVLGLTLAMELAVFRPLRNASPATMLVATFAISFLLQNIALLKFGVLGKIVDTLPQLNRPISEGGELTVRWIWIVAIIVAAVAL